MKRKSRSQKYAIGVDIERVGRFDTKKIGKPFLHRIYTAAELRYCLGKKHPAQHLAGRFAAKEAVQKALWQITGRHVDYRDIEIMNDEAGAPEVSFQTYRGKPPHVSVSISHTAETAIASAVLML